MNIPIDPTTRTSKGTAYITFKNSVAAIAAITTLDRTIYQGRLLHILPAIVRNAKPISGNLDGVKGSRLEAKKKESGTNGLNWGSLFMNVSLL